jgi:hypothetical protein
MTHLLPSLPANSPSFTNPIDQFIYSFNKNYEMRHLEYEQNFWSTKMNLQNASQEKLVQSKAELDHFLGNKEILTYIKDLLQKK